MPNDAKLGLVAGVALVIVVAVLYFHNDLGAGKSRGDAAAATVVGPAAAPAAPARGAKNANAGKTMSLATQDGAPAATTQMPKATDDDSLPELDSPRP
jgi:hypothetical protein